MIFLVRARNLAVLTALLLCWQTRPGDAALIAYDGFSYTAGSGLTGASGGTGWTSNWTAVSGVNVQSASLSYNSGSVLVNGGSLTAELDGTSDQTNAANRTFASQSGTTYMSLLFSAPTGLEASDFIHFMFNNDT